MSQKYFFYKYKIFKMIYKYIVFIQMKILNFCKNIEGSQLAIFFQST